MPHEGIGEGLLVKLPRRGEGALWHAVKPPESTVV